MRKPIGICSRYQGHIAVTCDDGSIWDKDPAERWKRISDVPQDQNELEKAQSLNDDVIKQSQKFEMETYHLKEQLEDMGKVASFHYNELKEKDKDFNATLSSKDETIKALNETIDAIRKGLIQ